MRLFLSFALTSLASLASASSRAHVTSASAASHAKRAVERLKAQTQSRPSNGPYRIEEIDRIPGLVDGDGVPTSKTYAGYIQVTEQPARHLWFYFATSQRDPETDPVVLWLNGGPGCSSMDGFMYEHGPYNFKMSTENFYDDEPLVEVLPNDYSWNTVANMIYLDSPASVGFSYTEDPHDVHRNDTQTAVDAETFLRLFFDYFTEFQENEVYLSGESYAGVYVPNLALHVARGNEAGREPRINLKGYLVGNGLTDYTYDGSSTPSFAYGHALISYELYEALQDTCQGVYWNVTPGSPCEKNILKMDAQLASLDLYDVLESCYHGPMKAGEVKYSTDVQASKGAYPGFTVGRGWPLRAVVKPGDEVPNWSQISGKYGNYGDVQVPCTNEEIADQWLNDPAVREALNAMPKSEIGSWNLCTDKIRYRHLTGSMLPVHQELIRRNIRALIYTGDHDLCIPWTGTAAWVRALKLKPLAEQQPWFVLEGGVDPQVAGYVRYYEGLTFATIKGAGHMVPQNKPLEALTMFDNFISGRKL